MKAILVFVGKSVWILECWATPAEVELQSECVLCGGIRTQIQHVEAQKMRKWDLNRSKIAKLVVIAQGLTCIVMQEARDALSKLQTVTLFRPIRSLQCSW